MNIMYCGDKNIADGLTISLMSLLKNVNEELNVYVLTLSFEQGGKRCEALAEDYIDYLDSIAKTYGENNSVKLIDVSRQFESFVPVKNLETRFTPGCMLRLYADMLPELPSRILYLDNDVICRKDFSDFYHSDIEGKELVGVLDYYGSWFFRGNILKRDYINSGVLLLNLEEIRKTGLFEKCRERCAKKKMFMPDQSAINKLSSRKVLANRRFNEQRKLKEDTVFQHFTTTFRFFPYIHTVTVKPWNTAELHRTLNIYEYDELIASCFEIKEAYETHFSTQKEMEINV